jgi:hypothetical protein
VQAAVVCGFYVDIWLKTVCCAIINEKKNLMSVVFI